MLEGKVITVVVVDDHDVVRKGMCVLLKRWPELRLIGEASTGRQAVKRVRELKPDLLILDLKLPDISGLEVSRRLSSSNPAIKILLLTSEPADLFLHLAFKAGAHSCITKSINLDELRSSITALFSNSIHPASMSPGPPNPFLDLSTREIEIVTKILQDLPVNKMAEQLHVDIKTIYAYRCSVFRKLNIKNEVALALLAKRYGIIGIKDL